MALQLAAILAADVVGYSKLMADDEAGTLAALKTHRKELFDPTTAKHGGRIVKLMGDGVLVEFPSVVDAVECALAIQKSLAEEAGKISLHIGINLGDVIIDGDDIYGDGVNIAARLEALAEPGGICVSGTVVDHVKGKVEVRFVDLSRQRVKNIPDPVHVYRVLLDGNEPAKTMDGSALPLPLPEKPSIAVLAFKNMSGDSEQEYFADGIAEDIITELSRDQDLFVIARNSSFAYKGQSPDLRRVAHELGVRYVLEGSVRRSGNRIRLNAQLIEAESNRHLWAERYDRDVEDIFAVQDELTATIQNAILQKVRETDIEHALTRAPKDLGAYDHMLRAFGLVLKFDRESNKASIAEATAALALDPDYARAFMTLAWAYLYQLWSGWADDPEQTIELTATAAQRAVAADRNNFWGTLRSDLLSCSSIDMSGPWQHLTGRLS